MQSQPAPLPPGFLLLGMLLAALGAGCTLGVAGASGVVGRALFGLISILSLVLVEALWWMRPWVVRATDAWVAACIGSTLLPALVGVLVGGLGFFELVLVAIVEALFVGLPCAGVRWYVRDRARRLGLAPLPVPVAVPRP